MAMNVAIVNWAGDELIRDAKGKAKSRMMETAYEVVDECKVAIGIPAPPSSLPGQFPHKRTGNLQSSFWVSNEGDAVIIANYAPYALELERGSKRVAMRPFMRPTIAKFRRRFSRLEIY